MIWRCANGDLTQSRMHNVGERLRVVPLPKEEAPYTREFRTKSGNSLETDAPDQLAALRATISIAIEHDILGEAKGWGRRRRRGGIPRRREAEGRHYPSYERSEWDQEE